MSARQEFEKFLKESDFFADIITTHRTASAEVMCGLIALMVENNTVSNISIIHMLKKLELSTSRPSIDSERRFLAATMRDFLQR